MDIIDKIGNRARGLVDIAKLHQKISEEKKIIAELRVLLSEHIQRLFNDGLVDDVVTIDICTRIGACLKKIDSYNADITRAKAATDVANSAVDSDAAGKAEENVQSDANASARNFCTACGAKISEDQRFCANCGEGIR